MSEITTRNTAVIIEALMTAYTKRDFTALERWFSPDYIQHNPFIPGKRAGLRSFIESLPRVGPTSPAGASRRVISS
jgi:predicted SnoaL-like aldol condensation-catalyzing enzyme